MSKKHNQAQRIVEVSHGICKSRVALFDDMVQTVGGFGSIQVFGETVLFSPDGTTELFRESLVLSKLIQHRLVHEVGNVLDIVERAGRCRPVVGLLFAFRFSGVNSCPGRS